MFNDYAVPIVFGLCIRFSLFAFWQFAFESFDKGEFATITILEVKIPFRNSDNITTDDRGWCPRKLVYTRSENWLYDPSFKWWYIGVITHWSKPFYQLPTGHPSGVISLQAEMWESSQAPAAAVAHHYGRLGIPPDGGGF